MFSLQFDILHQSCNFNFCKQRNAINYPNILTDGTIPCQLTFHSSVDVSSAVLSSVITEDRLIQQQQQQKLPVIFFTKLDMKQHLHTTACK